MKNKGWLVLFLVLVLVLGIVPVSAQADEGQMTAETGNAQIPFRVNPLYEDVYNPVDISKRVSAEEVDAPEGEVSAEYTLPRASTATYVDMDQAVVQMREAMKARKTSFDIYLKYDNSGYTQAAEEMMATVFDHTGDPEMGDYLLWHFLGWGASVEYKISDGYYNFHYVFEMAYYTTAAQETALDTAVSNLLKTLNVSGKSDYQKVKAVYDYICSNITYDYANLENDAYLLKYSAYAALVNKTAVCQGYVSLLYRLMLELGVDTRVITGETDGGAHGWNIVKLGDVYYNLDSTWDAGMSSYSYFLRNSEGFADHYRYVEYATTAFHTAYPMSATDYVDGVAGEPEYYYVGGICGADAYWLLSRDKVLTVFGTGATYDFGTAPESLPIPWQYWKGDFDTVVVEEGITRIGNYAFYYASNLKNVTLPETLTEIGRTAFGDCKKLTSIVIPDAVTILEHYTFGGCTALETVKLGSGLITIGSQAFESCGNLTQIQIPDKVVTIGNDAFYHCMNLASVELGDSVEYIGDDAFYYCLNLLEIVFPDSLTYIGTNAFYNCSYLTEVTIPENVTVLGGECFQKCHALKEIYFMGDAPKIGRDAFDAVTATAYYPGTGDTWMEDNLQNYGGTLTWVSMHTHSYESSVTAPTCTAEGFTLYICECGDSYKENITPALGHAMGQWVIESQPTDTECGVKSRACEVCGEIRSVRFDEFGILGDLTGDEVVDDQDVAYLLWSTLFPDMYPIKQSADFDGNGLVNDQDVAHLLWHTLFPEIYPL